VERLDNQVIMGSGPAGPGGRPSRIIVERGDALPGETRAVDQRPSVTNGAHIPPSNTSPAASTAKVPLMCPIAPAGVPQPQARSGSAVAASRPLGRRAGTRQKRATQAVSAGGVKNRSDISLEFSLCIYHMHR
jgi:hypothetical protein